MPLTQANIHLIETVVAFALIVLLNIFLKKRGILNGSDTPIFTRLLTQVVLPVFIFFQLLRYPPGVRYRLPFESRMTIVTMMTIREGCDVDIQAWTVAEAKAKFSEVIDKAKSDGPQTITRNGRKTVVIVAAEEWERKTRRKGNLAEFFAASPLRGSGAKVTRLRGRPRKVDL
jgi:prevent-host-death family protein